MLYYTILYYTIIYQTILYYNILYYNILPNTILYYTILYTAGGEGERNSETPKCRMRRNTECAETPNAPKRRILSIDAETSKRRMRRNAESRRTAERALSKWAPSDANAE